MKKIFMKHNPKTILIITYGGHGDILLTTPLITSLKTAYPSAIIDIYVQNGRGGMLAGNINIRTVIEEKHRHGIASYAEFLLNHTARYDLAISTRVSSRQILFCRAAGKKAISLLTDGMRGQRKNEVILNGWAYQNNKKHVVQDILQLASVLGIDKTTKITPPFDASSEARLNKQIPFSWKSEHYAVINLTPRNKYKEWSLNNWCSIVKHLNSHRLRTIIVGGSTEYDIEYANNLIKNIQNNNIINLTGKCSFADSATILKHCSLYIGLDTAMTHLSASMEIPTIALYGWHNAIYMPYHHKLHISPYKKIEPQKITSAHVQVIMGYCKCTNNEHLCEKNVTKHSSCMFNITPNLVTAAINQILTSSTIS